MEFVMRLVLWIDEVFNFCHLEFSYSKKSLLWANLISESKTELSSCKWHLTIVELNESSEIKENALSCLGSEETFKLTCWSNFTCEHQVEGLSS